MCVCVCVCGCVCVWMCTCLFSMFACVRALMAMCTHHHQWGMIIRPLSLPILEPCESLWQHNSTVCVCVGVCLCSCLCVCVCVCVCLCVCMCDTCAKWSSCFTASATERRSVIFKTQTPAWQASAFIKVKFSLLNGIHYKPRETSTNTHTHTHTYSCTHTHTHTHVHITDYKGCIG